MFMYEEGEVLACFFMGIVFFRSRIIAIERGPRHLIPYYSRTTPIRIPKDMGIVWEAYHKGVPLLGVPGMTLGSGFHGM